MIKEITLWFKGKYIIFNHLEDGHSKKGEPIFYCELQKRQWKGNVWRKRWAYLISYDNEIPNVDPDYWSE